MRSEIPVHIVFLVAPSEMFPEGEIHEVQNAEKEKR